MELSGGWLMAEARGSGKKLGVMNLRFADLLIFGVFVARVVQGAGIELSISPGDSGVELIVTGSSPRLAGASAEVEVQASSDLREWRALAAPFTVGGGEVLRLSDPVGERGFIAC